MSDIIVIGNPISLPTPPVGNFGYGGGLFSPSVPRASPSDGQIMLQVVLPYYQSDKFCTSNIEWLAQYIREHDRNDPRTWEVISNNIRYMCNADTNLVKNSKLSVYDAYHNPHSKPWDFDYVTMAQTQLSGDVTTPITAWAHYLWGNGQERFVKMTDVGFRINVNQIAPVMNIVNSGGVGIFNVSEKFTRDTMLDGVIPASYLGNVTLKTEGTLKIETSGAWTYNGVVRGYHDTYDANPGSFRGPVAEASTFVLSQLKGTEYRIALPGEIVIQGNGFR